MSISQEPDLSQLDDPALIGMREEMRGELERLPPGSRDRAELAAQYDLTTTEIDERARAAWSKTNQGPGPTMSWPRL
jgi:hypothetical protein